MWYKLNPTQCWWWLENDGDRFFFNRWPKDRVSDIFDDLGKKVPISTPSRSRASHKIDQCCLHRRFLLPLWLLPGHLAVLTRLHTTLLWTSRRFVHMFLLYCSLWASVAGGSWPRSEEPCINYPCLVVLIHNVGKYFLVWVNHSFIAFVCSHETPNLILPWYSREQRAHQLYQQSE